MHCSLCCGSCGGGSGGGGGGDSGNWTQYIVTCTVCWGGGVFFARAVVHTYTECMHCILCCDGGGGGYYVYFMHTKTELMIWSFHLV